MLSPLQTPRNGPAAVNQRKQIRNRKIRRAKSIRNVTRRQASHRIGAGHARQTGDNMHTAISAKLINIAAAVTAGAALLFGTGNG
ncbi:MAG: hypothetical protein E5Y60_26650, partial [Mesorhizobium sp.]